MAYVAVGIGMMLSLIYCFGELHGLISTVVIFIGQTGLLFMRVGMLQRQLQQAQPGPGA